MILEKIIAHKKVEVARQKESFPFNQLKTIIQDLSYVPRPPFSAALRRPGEVALIAEIKKASPSRGVIREDFDELVIAGQYLEAGAAAISVLTDSKFFGGQPGHLERVRRFTPLPLLRKDFIIDEYQIYHSRLLGADAVLLIAAVLSRRELSGFLSLAGEIGLSCLVEVHTEDEAYAAREAGATVIGINNRDLRTFETDLNTTLKLVRRVEAKNVTVVSESGIKTRADLLLLREHGVHAALVGEALMRRPNPGDGVRELLGAAAPDVRAASSAGRKQFIVNTAPEPCCGRQHKRGRDGMKPDARGYFGGYGGRFVPETLMPALEELIDAYSSATLDTSFQAELLYYLKNYVGRPSPLYFAEGLTRHCGGARIYLKREDLNHTGAHKINNTIGQALLARRMGKTRVIAETGAGQHGVATATAAALFGFRCAVYMGEEDIQRQSPNVFRMRLLGAEVIPVSTGSRTLKDAMNEAIRDWVTNVEDTYYLIGSVAGPHPYPAMVRDFQSVIGTEAKEQMLRETGRLPDYVVACVGGGSNAMGIFYSFLLDAGVKLIGVEAAGRGLSTAEHAATLGLGKPGVLHGSLSYILQDEDGQIKNAHSISAGLDYPGVGPEHAYLKDSGRAKYTAVTDDEALAAFQLLCRTDGIIPALESAHAIAEAVRLARELEPEQVLLVNLSGRGDKDVNVIAGERGVSL